ncbi:MAG TPA: glycoside hydrolase family 3 C-terminal domain-containing protein [Candidatus Mediterraneibacter excrementavium]|nr:glycoside hydrolase family 3 C-terminal domain-containing protein [Candidatus Mediterraneibacter excrementavium]
MEKKKEKNRKKMSNKAFSIICGVPLAVVLIALTIGNAVALQYQTIITRSLGHATSEIVNFDESGASDYYASDFSSEEELKAHEQELSRQLMAEGMVMLKNDDHALPLASGAKVSLFSTSSVNFLYGASAGSSGAVDTSSVESLKDVFETEGFEVNPTLWDFYAGRENQFRNGLNIEVPVAEYSQEVLDSFAGYGDAAVIVLSRGGQEAMDMAEGSLGLTEDEAAMIAMVNDSFDNIVVLLNTANPMELGWMNDYANIKACIWAGFPGQFGITSIPQILNGTENPSGKLVDTYAYSSLNSPAMSNFGSGMIENGVNDVSAKNTYTVYGENIYVGYRYYETRYEDAVLGQGGADSTVGSADGAPWDYGKEVQFPFGHGLSYTDFSYDNFVFTDNGDDTFTVSVDVTNTGDTAGKEVVELYFQSPYTDYDRENLVEKASVELVGFEKTEVLEPGQTESVEIIVDKEELRTYDAYGAGTYIVDAGTYYFTVAEDAHAAVNNILAAKGYTEADGMDAEGDAAFVGQYVQDTLDTETYSVDSSTGTEIVNQFDNGSISYYDETYKYLTRSDWEGTWPVFYGEADEDGDYSITAGDELYHDSQDNLYEQDPEAQMPVTDSGEGIRLITMRGKDYDDPAWEDVLDCLTVEEMAEMVRLGGWQTAELTSVSKPKSNDQDGPAGISDTLIGTNLGCTGYPIAVVIASTWNVDLADDFGKCIGEDGLSANVHGWYAPGGGLHRTPYGGRNFEYWSEDSFLSGKIVAPVIAGAQDKGMYAYMKHLVLNDQEDRRYGIATFVTEQALREIYLEPFEKAVKEADCRGMMAAFNGLGGIWCGANKALITNVLTDEWGFHGIVVTDYASANDGYMWIDMGLQAGTDLWLNSDSTVYPVDTEDATLVNHLRDSAHDILYTVVNSAAMNGMSEDTEIREVLPLWKIWLICLDVAVVLIEAGCIFLIRRRCKKNKQN